MSSSRKRRYPLGKDLRSRSKNQSLRPIEYKFLQEMEKEWVPQDIAVFFTGKLPKLELRLKGELDTDMIALLLKVIVKLMDSDGMKECLAKILVTVLNCNFQEKIATFINGLSLKCKAMDSTEPVLHINNALKLVSSFLTIIPMRSVEKVSMTMVIIKSVIDGGVGKKSREFFEEVSSILENVREMREEKQSPEEQDSDDFHSRPPPDNFRLIPVFPQIEDVLSTARPFIRANLVDKAYQSVDHYLDVQFRLLREDFIRPLRDGISEIIRHNNTSAKKLRSSLGSKVYENVSVYSIRPHPRGILHRLRFSTEHLARVRWQNTKRLLSGNMICLSSDNFENDFLFAVVVERIPDDLKQGFVSVQFISEEEALEEINQQEDNLEVEKIDLKKKYIMVETEAYFEAYRHVLAALKERTKLPLERYIVHCLNDMKPPQYLIPAEDQPAISFNFTALTKGAKDVDVLHGDWPSDEEMGLDESQTKAVKLALTSELAIIQGPPGTGKTHVGLLIVKLLLMNKNKWSRGYFMGIRSPILLVCYTNHALDQFLEGVSKFTHDSQIVRVGGRCKHNATKQFALFEKLKQTRAFGYQSNAKKAARSLRREMRSMRDRFNAGDEKLQHSLEHLVSLDQLAEFIPRNLYQQFADLSCVKIKGKKYQIQSVDKTLEEWLYLSDEHSAKNLSTAVLLSIGHRPCDIRRAFSATGSTDTNILHGWIEESKGTEDSDDASYSDSELSDGEIRDDNVVEEAEFVQEQRLLEEDHWKERRYSTMMTEKLKAELQKNICLTNSEERRVSNIESMRKEDRWRLYRTWLNRWKKKIRTAPTVSVEAYNRVARQLQEVKSQDEARILANADVIALTTTGAAKYRNLIYGLNCKIVVIEEAAEVMEAHIITSLPRSTEHLILIGDHQQLKPSPTVYELAKHYKLDTSLFERLIGKIPHVTLTEQHRMRPEIANLIRPHIYNNLQDHKSVRLRGDITGVQKPVYFVSHQVHEQSLSDGKSKRNDHEAEFLTSLCEHILIQGYHPSQITILAMYSGQLFAFRDKLRKAKIQGVKVTVVDNYQGEESDIILLSLVRSNNESKIGFLKTDNRVCVALSRAKIGLYVIGNMELLASQSQTWRSIVSYLKTNDMIGDSLTLQCKNHPDKLAQVKTAEDFSKILEGGCGQACEIRLNCGHVCERLCHPDGHELSLCTKPCNKYTCGHKCPRKCNEICPPCTEKVIKIFPKCGHEKKTDCYQNVEELRCNLAVDVYLPCGHWCPVSCNVAEKATVWQCTQKCSFQLDCGHICSGKCCSCSQGRLHRPCKESCGRVLVCGHSCESTCNLCPSCQKPCASRCIHSTCDRTCGRPCVPCAEECAWKCEHHKCQRLCSEPCDRPPCNEPCSRKLPCKHPCIGLCGEPCPRLCRICDKKEVTQIFFGDEDEPDARFVELQDCGHVFTFESLDRWMNQEEISDAIKMKECPRCKTIIWKSARYGEIINKLIGSLNEVKKLKLGDEKQLELDRKNLREEINAFLVNKSAESPIKRELERTVTKLEKKLSSNQTMTIEMKLKRLQKLQDLQKEHEKLRDLAYLSAEHMQVVSMDLKFIFRWICVKRETDTNEESKSFERETKRIVDALEFISTEAKYNAITDETRKERLKPTMLELKQILITCRKPYEDQKKESVKALFSLISETAPDIRSPIGITHEEKDMICKAMGFYRKGHWFKCPKGHIYAIGECGGATQISKCPECKENIGGSRHTLLATNTVATEMDGATHSAYDQDAVINRIPGGMLARFQRDGFG